MFAPILGTIPSGKDPHQGDNPFATPLPETVPPVIKQTHGTNKSRSPQSLAEDAKIIGQLVDNLRVKLVRHPEALETWEKAETTLKSALAQIQRSSSKKEARNHLKTFKEASNDINLQARKISSAKQIRIGLGLTLIGAALNNGRAILLSKAMGIHFSTYVDMHSSLLNGYLNDLLFPITMTVGLMGIGMLLPKYHYSSSNWKFSPERVAAVPFVLATGYEVLQGLVPRLGGFNGYDVLTAGVGSFIAAKIFHKVGKPLQQHADVLSDRYALEVATADLVKRIERN